MKTTIKFLALAFVAMAITFTACKKNEEAEDNELATSEDMALSENQYDQVFKQVDGNATNAGLKKGYPIVTIDSV